MVGAYGVPKCRLYVIHMDAEMSSHGTEFTEKTLKTLSCSCVKELHSETHSTYFHFIQLIIALGPITILVLFRLIVQPYKSYMIKLSGRMSHIRKQVF